MNYKQISYNVTPIANRTIEYIVIHDTGNKNKGANAEMHYRYFNSGNRNASTDFFVDDTQILKTNDYTKKYTWHVGDGKGEYGVTNRNSIGIEMCVNSDVDFQKVLSNTIELVKELKKEFPNAKVVRHYDASKKLCPASLSYNSWQGWAEFLKRLEEPKETGPHWAEDSLSYLKKSGMIIHEKRFDDNVTRAELFAVIAQLLSKIDELK